MMKIAPKKNNHMSYIRNIIYVGANIAKESSTGEYL
jgi:hypothetical protein